MVDKKRSALSKQLAAQQAAERLAEAEKRFKIALQENGFDYASDFKKARCDKDERESLREDVKDFKERWAAATDRKDRAEEADDVKEPDVEGAQGDVDTLKEKLDKVKETLIKLEVEVEETKEALQSIEDIEEDLQKADERYSQLGFLRS